MPPTSLVEQPTTTISPVDSLAAASSCSAAAFAWAVIVSSIINASYALDCGIYPSKIGTSNHRPACFHSSSERIVQAAQKER